MNDTTAETTTTDGESTLESAETPARKQVIDLLLKALAGAVSVAGVAVIGQAVAWTRFEAADLPANQAIVALGQEERVAIGATALTVFLLAGLLAVAVVYVLDRQADPTRRRTRWGLVLLMIAGVIGGSLLSLGGRREFWCALILVAATVIVIWRLTRKTEKSDSVPTASQKRSLWLKRLGPLAVLMVLLAIVACLSGDEDGYEVWFPLLFLAVALALGGLALGIAAQTGTTFRWYGVAVFLSVVLFGGVVNIARTFNTPKVQSAAVLYQEGASVGGVHGIYVADNDDRIYLGSVELNNDGAVKAASGATFWIPCERVLTYAVGALQTTPAALARAETLLDELRRKVPVTAAAAQPAQGTAAAGQDETAAAEAETGSCPE